MADPIAVPDGNIETNEDSVLTIPASELLANDSDIDGDTITIISVQEALNGTVSLDLNGDVVFTPDPNYSGPALFTYTISDGNGGVSTASVSIDILAVNDAPVVVTEIPDQLVDENSPVQISTSSFFEDVDVSDVLTYSATLSDGSPLPEWLSLDPVTGEIAGLAPCVCAGGNALEITVTASDGTESISDTFNLTVQNVNATPVALNDVTEVREDSTLLISSSDLLANDSDPEGDTLTIVSVQNSFNGTVALDVDGNVIFEPDAGYFGPASFSYTISDGNGGTSTATCDLTVHRVLKGAPGTSDYTFGTEAQVNTFTAGGQTSPSITALSDGGYVVVWQSANQDGSGSGIYGQRYDATGLAAGAEFQINQYTQSDQNNAQLVGLSNGGFAVVWQSDNQNGEDFDIYARVYEENGTPVGDEFHVNIYDTSGNQLAPEIAALPDGGFTVIWSTYDRKNYDIAGQRFDSSGNHIDQEFVVGTARVKSEDSQKISVLEDGSFVVVWHSYVPGSSKYDILGQRYNPDGTAAGAEFLINTSTARDQDFPEIASLEGGGFVVVWQSDRQDGDDYGIYGQLYDANGIKVDSEFQINSYSADAQAFPSVTGLPDGGFVVTWQSYGQDGSGDGIFAQRFDAGGVAVDEEFQVNDFVTGEQSKPEVTALNNGTLVFTWQSEGIDGDEFAITSKVLSIVPEITGTTGNDVIEGSPGDDFITGLAGDDLLTGGAGNDTFYFAADAGVDTITDFQAGAGADDLIVFEDTFTDFNDLLNSTTQNGSDLVIDTGDGSSVTLTSVNFIDLHADDFLFV